jgi:hypothetical protein
MGRSAGARVDFGAGAASTGGLGAGVVSAVRLGAGSAGLGVVTTVALAIVADCSSETEAV